MFRVVCIPLICILMINNIFGNIIDWISTTLDGVIILYIIFRAGIALSKIHFATCYNIGQSPCGLGINVTLQNLFLRWSGAI